MKLYVERSLKTNSEFVDRRRKLIGGRREKFTKGQRKFALSGVMNINTTVI
jgi:hypothetical protein